MLYSWFAHLCKSRSSFWLWEPQDPRDASARTAAGAALPISFTHALDNSEAAAMDVLPEPIIPEMLSKGVKFCVKHVGLNTLIVGSILTCSRFCHVA